MDNTTANVERGQFTRLSMEVDLTNKPLLSKFRLTGRIWCVQYEDLRMVCFKCGTQGHKEDACPLDQATDKDGINMDNAGSCNGKMTKPEEETTYESWMLVQKPVRRRATRQQPPTDGRTNEELGLNRQRGHVSSNQNAVSPALENEMGINTNEEGVVYPKEGSRLKMENIIIAGDNHGSRFRALENLDFNLELETGIEGEEAQGDKEDSSHTPEIPNVDRSQVKANNQESITEQEKGNNLGKEKTPQRSVNRPREQQNKT